MIEDKLKHFAVKVNQGSGCIFQPATDQYTYILTVKHNIERTVGADEVPTLLMPAEVRVIRSGAGQTVPLTVQAVLAHPDLDIALIVVDFIGKTAYELVHARPEREEAVMIYGYPNMMKDAAVKSTNVNCTCNIEYLAGVSFEIETAAAMNTFNRCAAENIIGFSGSGVFYVAGDQLILKGIFPELGAPDGALGKLLVFYTELFNDLAIARGYLEMVPEGLLSFGTHKAEALNTLSLPIKRSVRTNIDRIAGSSITPSAVADRFKGNLQVPHQANYFNVINNPKLWKAWLDLLTFLDVATEDPDYTLNVFLRNIRLYYSPDKLIIDEMIKAFLTDSKSMDSIDDNSIVVFSGDLPSAKKYLDKAKVKRIVKSIYDADIDTMQVDHPDLVKNFCCIDIAHFADKVADIETTLNPAEIRDLVKEEVLKILDYGNH